MFSGKTTTGHDYKFFWVRSAKSVWESPQSGSAPSCTLTRARPGRVGRRGQGSEAPQAANEINPTDKLSAMSDGT